MAKKILIVDDEPHLLTLMESRFVSSGYEVATASDGREGLEKAKSEKPDLIILDILMPEMTGYEFMQKFKQDKEIRDIPVIIASAKGSMKDFFSSWEVFSFIPKPFDWDVLHAQVQAAVGQKRYAPGKSRPQAPQGLVKRAVILAADEFIAKKLKNFLREKHIFVLSTSDDKESVEMVTQIQADILLCQYGESWNVDLEGIYGQLVASPENSPVVFAVFCLHGLEKDAGKIFKEAEVLTYDGVDELMEKTGKLLERLSLQR